MTKRGIQPRARVLGPHAGEIAGAPHATDRFMVNGEETGSRFALVEHTIAPGVLAGPLHRHTREDEYSYVLQGRVGARLGGEEIFADAGDLIFKPRGQWHTFWNAGDVPLRILELISPAGLEQLFREMGALGDQLDPDTLQQMAASYGAEIDFDGTTAVVKRHRLAY